MGSPIIQESLAANFKEDGGQYRAFYAAGGLAYDKMGTMDRMMVKAFAGMLKSKKGKSEAEEQMAEAIGQSCDLSRREYLQPIVDYVKGLR